VFVHGAITDGPTTWAKQLPLAERWQVEVVTRPGFAPQPPIARCDFEPDAQQVAALLVAPAHVVGHSYGGLVALLAAAQRPERVNSLTLIEPAVFSLVRGDPLVEESIKVHERAVAEFGHDARAFMANFTQRLGGDPSSLPDPLPDAMKQNVELLINERYPWTATIPVAAVRAAPFRTLVVSGGHDPMQEMMCDAVVDHLEPHAERAVIVGRGHNVQRTGEAFNDRLEAFLRAEE
jgi:pimeloyl-ACP methyl ester carboxylesterase